jgi:hypothetical protein
MYKKVLTFKSHHDTDPERHRRAPNCGAIVKKKKRNAAKEQSSVEINDANSFLASAILNYIAFLYIF